MSTRTDDDPDLPGSNRAARLGAGPRDRRISVEIAIARWHDARQNHQQHGAAAQALTHLRTAYQQTAAVPLAHLTARAPGPPTVDRHAQQVRAVLPEYADRIFTDPA